MGGPAVTLSIPTDAPFTHAQQNWLAGFLAGIAAARRDQPEQSVATLTVEILVGTQTGNSEELAGQLSNTLRSNNLGANVTHLDDMPIDKLMAASHVLVITSTYGEGEMPDNAELFWDALGSPAAPRLESTRFAVLALGDSGYDDFCQAGKLIDTRFEQLGAQRIIPRVDCDVDFEEPATAWITDVVGRLAAEAPATTGAPVAASIPTTPAPSTKKWSRKSPYPSRLVANRVISGPGSDKEIRHYEFALGDSGIEYAAGDALAVVPLNDTVLVEEMLGHLGLDGDATVGEETLAQRLSHALEIRLPSKDLMAALAQRHPKGELAALLARAERESLENWLWGRDTVDLLREYPDCGFDAEEFCGMLRPLQQRAYSISSSPLASPDRIHLTVASVRYGDDRIRGGVCSTFLADRLHEEDPVGIYLQPNAAFRVPTDDDLPMIMIGPGTGLAPFRGFLQERAARGASGDNWLFFGDRHRADDFIYEEEILAFSSSGVLDRLDLAFSRDQAQKIYVQTRMLEQGKDLYDWLERGAHIYVCGDASRMAKDVDSALRTIIETHRAKGPADADEYVANLKRAKRYVRDVY